MGTTSEKLTYLNQTKQKLKQAINNIGGEVTDETTFREYAEELQDIYDNLPKTEYQEGSSITLENTLKGKLDFEDGIVGIGDTSQKSYNGYNLLNIDTITSYEKSGVTISYDNGYLKLNGTATAQFDIYLNANNYTNYNAFKDYCNSNYDEYTMSLENNTQNLLLYARLKVNEVTQYFRENFTTSADSILQDHFIRVASGKTFNNALIGVMIEKGSTAHDWEPYVGRSSFS